MKYEMIFGDEKLFDGAPESATHAVKGGGFYSVKNKFVSYVSSGIFNGSNVEAFGGYLIAERRIIKEPNRWTWEDKKAGRLPEVGAEIHLINDIKSVEFVGTDGGHNLWYFKRDNGAFGYARAGSFKPIETPAEKAQREEDEFVASVIDLASENQLMSCGFKDGVIAAYRKLKGGE